MNFAKHREYLGLRLTFSPCALSSLRRRLAATRVSRRFRSLLPWEQPVPAVRDVHNLRKVSLLLINCRVNNAPPHDMHTFASRSRGAHPPFSLSFLSNRVTSFSFFLPSEPRHPPSAFAYSFLRRGKARCNECATHQDIARNISLPREETLPSVNFNFAPPRTFLLFKIVFQIAWLFLFLSFSANCFHYYCRYLSSLQFC